MFYVYVEKNSSWEEVFRSNWIWDLGDINWGKFFAVRQNKNVRQSIGVNMSNGRLKK
jgi:hypothetical protein